MDMTLFAEAVMTGLIGLWMATGALDNWRFPELNRATVAQVMRMERMEQQYPEEFSHVAHRRVSDVRVVNLAFRLIVLWESLSAILLCLGSAMLAVAALTGGDIGFARNIAIAGALSFTVNWAGFLIGGNYLCYYYCHFEGQFTHFMLVIWGSLVCTLLVLSA